MESVHDNPRKRFRQRAIRVALVQRTISRYRVPLFHRLSTFKDLDITCFYSRGNRFGAPQVDVKLPFKNEEVPILYNPRSGQALYQGVLTRILRGKFDVVVCTQQINNLAPLVLWSMHRFFPFKFIWWGIGFDPFRQRSPGSRPEGVHNRAAVRIKDFLWKKADGRMVYSAEGLDYSKRLGINPDRVAVLHNTLDVEHIRSTAKQLDDSDLESLKAELGIGKDTFVYIFIGRLHRFKEVPFLVNAFAQVAAVEKNVKLLIVGDGEERKAVDTAICQANLKGKVVTTGAIYDEKKLAQLFLISNLVVMPGQVGLAICHAFAYGKPILTRWSRSYSPELEYLENGVNGLKLEDNSVEALARVMVQARQDHEQTQRWSKAAWQTGHEMNIGHMAERFRDAIVSVMHKH